MEIRQMKYFVEIAESGSFSTAARRFFLSQSAISQQVKAMEQELDTLLFLRTPHKVELTESGRILLPMAKQIIQDINMCEERMGDIHKTLSGELHIGLTCSVESMVRRASVLFMRMYPEVRLHIHYKTIPEMIVMLREGQLDMAFSIIIPGEEDWVDSLKITSYRICAVMRSTHPLANRKVISTADLERQPLILPECGRQSKNAIQEFLGISIPNFKARAIINDTHAILSLLKCTNSISILSEGEIRKDDELIAIPIAEVPTPVDCYVHQLKGGFRKRSAEAFLRLIKQDESTLLC